MIYRRIHFPSYILFLGGVFLAGILFFSGFRIIFLLTHIQQAKTISGLPLFLEMVLQGLRFDICICCYLLSVPFLLLSAASFFRSVPAAALRVAGILTVVLFSMAFFICAADIPYFGQFNARITTSALLWADNPGFVIGMIFGDLSYSMYVFLFLFVCLAFNYFIKKFRTKIISREYTPLNYSGKIIFFLLTGMLLALGMRGRIAAKSPIRVGTAFFSDDAFANQFALNPVFSFFSSLKEDMKERNKRLHLMDENKALHFVRKSFHVSDSSGSPVTRKVISEKQPQKMNVVVVIMESMSMYNMGKYGGKTGLTPYLDSLAKNSLFFENAYAQGIHTFNGIYSTLFSFPALLKQQPMLKILSKKYGGMPAALKNYGYKNIFFITHDGQFDNAEGFLRANGFDEVYAEDDYPSEKIMSTLGAPDDFMFEFSIQKMNTLSSEGKKFFCGFMTGSNHPPYIFPEWAKISYKGENERERIIEYSDWAIGKFMRLASGEPWYRNTIFVFVADHGNALGGVYDMPLSYHHTPLIIHVPGLNPEPKNYDCLGSQMDIFPTVMGIMNSLYVNNTMGIDLLKKTRPYIYFTADDKIGCLDKEYFFIHRMNGTESLYRYKNSETTDLMQQYKFKADSMRTYAYSMLQTAQWVIEKEKFSEK